MAAPATPAPQHAPRSRGLRVAAWVAVAAALAAVFAAYLQPHMVFDLATRIWACF